MNLSKTFLQQDQVEPIRLDLELGLHLLNLGLFNINPNQFRLCLTLNTNSYDIYICINQTLSTRLKTIINKQNTTLFWLFNYFFGKHKNNMLFSYHKTRPIQMLNQEQYKFFIKKKKKTTHNSICIKFYSDLNWINQNLDKDQTQFYKTGSSKNLNSNLLKYNLK